jgi:hypothetical protein
MRLPLTSGCLLEQTHKGYFLPRPPTFLAHAISSQQIAHRAMRPDATQRDAAGIQLAVQFMQHARPRQIKIRRCENVADHETNLRGASQTKAIHDDIVAQLGDTVFRQPTGCGDKPQPRRSS